MYEHFTDRALKAMELANDEARRLKHEYVGTEHILLGLISEGTSIAANVLKNLDVDFGELRLEVERVMCKGFQEVIAEKLPMTPRAKKAIAYSTEAARSLNHNYVGTEHLLLGLMREGEGLAAQVLIRLGLSRAMIRGEVLVLLGFDPDRFAKRGPVPMPANVNKGIDKARKHLDDLIAVLETMWQEAIAAKAVDWSTQLTRLENNFIAVKAFLGRVRSDGIDSLDDCTL